MDTIIVLVIVGLAVLYLVRRFVRAFRPQAENACGCGCADCGPEANCASDAPLTRTRSGAERH
jgi:hypothetical protein